jgi:hypothetical protein
MRFKRTAIGALAATAALAVGIGAALAAGPEERAARCDARLAKLAEKRGVTVEQLRSDIQARLLARIDAAEKAGRISQERAASLRGRAETARPCGARAHVRAHLAGRGMIRAAADFLGLDRAELRAQLPGTSLVALAAKQGKSEASLEAAMVAPAKARLTKAVANGRITQAGADAALARLARLADRLANRTFPTR